ncbi:Uncharacterised protein [Cedecea lapagei]|uniref:Uncharacterized protein n=1 Tax=Cedecea lapagei TaxID=158823 RepID=A0A447V5P2_9ENTR|nr:hypothetical protein [Cedecea lapagei]VEB99926.1 Uncharacterised protein [Cedecea lapagei]
MTYQKRKLKFEFKLEKGAFNQDGDNILTIDNIKASVNVGGYGGTTGTVMNAEVYGLSLDKMALLSFKGIQYEQTLQNMMRVWANDELIFTGSIGSCYIDLGRMPEAPLIIQATSTFYDQSLTSADFTVKGEVKVADIITAMAKEMGFAAVITSDVTEVETDPFYHGNLYQQMTTCMRAHDLTWDFRNGAVYVWKYGGQIDEVMPFVSAQNGLIGYPIFNGFGVTITTMFSSMLVRGRNLKLETELPNASGVYGINESSHILSTWQEGGPWYTQCNLSLFTQGAPDAKAQGQT